VARELSSGTLRENGINGTFVQDNHLRSRQSVLRGLHFQVQRSQAQVVTVICGRIFDVTVDLRPSSSSAGGMVSS
jgi:dTDP-4-dehydrorhamnose 3,5-epimerase